MRSTSVTRHGHFHPCPFCGKPCDAAGATSRLSPPPKPGDYSICLYCAAVAVFADERGTTRKPTQEETAALKNDPEASAHVARVRSAIRQVMADRRNA